MGPNYRWRAEVSREGVAALKPEVCVVGAHKWGYAKWGFCMSSANFSAKSHFLLMSPLKDVPPLGPLCF